MFLNCHINEFKGKFSVQQVWSTMHCFATARMCAVLDHDVWVAKHKHEAEGEMQTEGVSLLAFAKDVHKVGHGIVVASVQGIEGVNEEVDE